VQLLAACLAALLTGCATAPGPSPGVPRSAAAVAAGNEVVLAAMGFVDVAYRAGGNTAAEGFDCSGFTRHVYASALGMALPRRAEAQAELADWPAVEAADLAPGDLVFFNTLNQRYSHVGIYVGDGRFVHAPRAGARVRIEGMGGAYWARRFDGGRRLPQAVMVGAALPR
jgi:cell wall-associated NlpC family hydrolase